MVSNVYYERATFWVNYFFRASTFLEQLTVKATRCYFRTSIFPQLASFSLLRIVYYLVSNPINIEFSDPGTPYRFVDGASFRKCFFQIPWPISLTVAHTTLPCIQNFLFESKLLSQNSIERDQLFKNMKNLGSNKKINLNT